MGEEQRLNLSLSLVSHTTKTRNHNISCELSTTSDGSSDGILECTYDNSPHQTEIFRLLQTRNQMLSQDHISQDSSKMNGVQLINLLLKSATAILNHSSSSAVSNLIHLYENASFMGDSPQRLAAYYAEALTTKLLKQEKSCPLYTLIMREPSQCDEFLAFTHMYKLSPCYQFSHFTANQAILEAFEREQPLNNSQLHILDFDLGFGLQWPSMIQSLSEQAKPGNPVFLRITGFGSSLDELAETETRLVSFAKGFDNVVFEFRGLVRGSKLREHQPRRGETLAVNLVLSYLHRNNNNNSVLKISDTVRWAHSVCPSVVVVVQREGGCDRGEASVVPRLMDALHYYAAMMGSLEDCLPRESVERMCIERNHLGMEMRREIVDQESMSWARYEGLERWKERMERAGFEGIKMSRRTVMQAKLLVRMRSQYQPQLQGGGGFGVVERESGKAISIAWQDRVLITATAWKPV